jgi:hypothetical protein
MSPPRGSRASLRSAAGGALVVGAAAIALGIPAVASARDACVAAGLSAASAKRAYGSSAYLQPFTELGNAPGDLANVSACFIYAEGDVVATVRVYPGSYWSKLAVIYDSSRPKPRQVALAGLGSGALQYDVLARPGNYEEDIVFRRGTAVVTVRSPVKPFGAAPPAPLPPLVVLAREIYAKLPSAR